MELTELAGIGPVRAETLRAMGIFSLRDLLYTLPVRYEDHSTISPCATKQAGMILVKGTLVSEPRLSFFHGLKKVSVTIEDETGKMPVCWYNMPWIINDFHAGQEIRLYGRLYIKGGRRVLQNPRFDKEEEGLVPVYRSMKGFPAKSFRKLIRSAWHWTMWMTAARKHFRIHSESVSICVSSTMRSGRHIFRTILLHCRLQGEDFHLNRFFCILYM